MPSASAGETVGFVGLGEMGLRMCEALLDAGHALAVHDAREEPMRELETRGATRCASPAEVADRAETVLVSLPRPEIVREVACGGDGLLHGKAIRAYVDLSTTGAAVAEQVAATLGEAGVKCLDAPVSGGVAGVLARRLTVMTSGEAELDARVRPLLETFAGKVLWVGPSPGQGQTAKLLNNLLSATAMAVTSEAMTFAVSAGLDPQTLLEIFNSSSGQNTATRDKFPTHVLTRRFEAGFRLELMAKDVELCLAEARSRRTPMFVGAVVQQLWSLAASAAEPDDDHTRIVELYERWGDVVVAERSDAHAGGSSAHV
ncbi:MAG TPA: NAD(P)-dependent oxidoreductase [Solirubrobacteraceae bacterium]